ncbi:MAG TPA: helix-turn-helix domain-containing protein [Thermoanaerobaculia bacterium]|nr:helix-turn-helix domain-containing protein [Thermoanaerobaculia bacterium]
MVRPQRVEPRGILHLREPAAMPGYRRFRPDGDLARFVEHYWTVEWDLDEPVVREVLPHPSVHLALDDTGPRLVGVQKGRFTRRLEGKGRVLGVKFRPGGFRPFLGAAVSNLTDRTWPAGRVFGSPVEALAERALSADAAEAFDLVQSFLLDRLPAPDARGELAARITDRAASDRAILRVEPLAGAFGIGLRALQRLFVDYVGVSPKWVIQRYRLHEALERIAADGGRIDWPALAFDLGYADQAHFIRDFRRFVGRSPVDYERSLG